MKYDRISRRMFLQGAGHAALAIPFLPSLLPSQAEAAVIPPSKYIHINSSWCLPREQTIPLYASPYPSYPQPAGTNPDSVPWLQKDADTKYQSLAAIVAFQGKLSWVLDEKWNPFVSRMNLVTNAHAYMPDNLYNSSVGPTASSDRTGGVGSPNANGPGKGYAYSVDFLMEQAIYRSQATPRIPTVRMYPFNPAGENEFLGFCWGTVNGVEKRLPMMNSLADLKAALGGVSVAATTSRRSLVIDSVLADFKALMGHRRISADDKQRLSNAADLWHGIQSGISGATCSAPNFDTATTNWRTIHELSMDTMAMLLACGVTRNISYGLVHGGDNIQDIPGVADSRVPGESDPSITDPYYATLRWRSDRVTYFLSKLDALKDESGQSLLNSCLTAWTHMNGNGNHGMLGHSMIVVGGNGKLDLGHHVDAGGAPVNRFHLTNMMAMGLQLSDIEKNGRPGFGQYSDTIQAAAGGFITSEKDNKQDDPSKRVYDLSKAAHFFQDAEKRKPFPYLK